MIDIDKIWQTVIAIMLAIAGGLARLLNLKDKTKLKFSRIISELFISGFSGLMILMLVRVSGLSGDLVGVAAGIAGWIGPRALDLVANSIGKKVGIDFNKKDEELTFF